MVDTQDMDSQKGVAHLLLMAVLLAGLAFAVYLVQQKTNLFSRATSHPISGPMYLTPPGQPPAPSGGPLYLTPTYPVATPTPKPLNGNTWGSRTVVVCSDGSAPARRGRTRLIYAIWPDEPYDLNDPVKYIKGEWSPDLSKSEVMSIRNKFTTAAVYVAVEDESGGYLIPKTDTPHKALVAQTFFGIPMVRWFRNELPPGYYNLEFQAPSSWCQ